MIELRTYQTEGIANLRALMAQGHRAIVRQLPTGGGKSLEIKTICEAAAAKGMRVCIMAHREELLEQIAAKLDHAHGWIKSGKPIKARELVQVASVQTLVNRLDRYLFDVLIIDEAHHSPSTSYRRILAAYPKSRVIGFTATPQRLDGKPLSDVFSAMATGPSVTELQAMGYLKPADYYGPAHHADLGGVRRVRGDFDNAALATAMNKPHLTGDAIDHYRRLADGQPAILFGVSRKHIHDCAAQFNAASYRFVAIDGTMDRKIIKGALADLSARRIHGVCSCELISEGIDVPIVSVGIMLRPTQSLSLHLQQLGRCLRPAEGYPVAVILDHAGNCKRHGFAETPRVWTLDGIGEVESESDRKKKEPIQCMACSAIHAPMPVCPKCGHVHYETKARELDKLEGELTKLDTTAKPGGKGPKTPEEIEQAKLNKATPLEDKREYFKSLMETAVSKGYKHQWASYKYKALFGVWPTGFKHDVMRELGIEVPVWQKPAYKTSTAQ